MSQPNKTFGAKKCKRSTLTVKKCRNVLDSLPDPFLTADLKKELERRRSLTDVSSGTVHWYIGMFRNYKMIISEPLKTNKRKNQHFKTELYA